jgi:hypothetical protein
MFLDLEVQLLEKEDTVMVLVNEIEDLLGCLGGGEEGDEFLDRG